ncbi:MAG: BglG family transcription antiterminator [Clostridium sp.]
MNKRAREIIFWIMEKRDYQETCTITDLIDKFKVSERTIRYDLEGITDFLLENKQKPIQLCEHGVIELQKDTDAIRSLLGQNDFYSFKLSKEERMNMILYLIANTSEHVTLQQLADILFVSRSTVIHDVDDVRKSIQKHDLEIVSLRRGLRIQGKESSRRILLMHLLRMPYVQQFRTTEYTHMMSPQDLDSLKRMIKDAELSSSRFLTDGSFEDLRQYLMLMIERYHKHLFVEIDYVSQHMSTQKMANHLMNKLEDYFGMEHRLQEEYLLADILYNMHYLKRNDADEKIMQIQVISKQFIDAVAHDLNIDLRNDFQFYQNLTNHLQSTFKDLDMGYDSDSELLYEIVKKNPR